MPVSTSPLPPLARPEFPVVFTSTLPAGRGGDGPVALQHQDAAVGRGESPGPPPAGPRADRSPPIRANSPSWGVSTVTRSRRASSTSICPASAFMPSASSTTGCRISRSRLQHQLRHAAAPAQAGAKGQLRHSRPARRKISSFALGDSFPCLSGRGKGMAETHLAASTGQMARRHPQGHQAAPGPHRRCGGEIGGPGVAHRAAHDQHLAEGALVAVRSSEGAGRCGRSPAPPSGPGRQGLPDQIRRDADVPDLHRAGADGPLPHRLADLWAG